jgi:hypothetical protein
VPDGTWKNSQLGQPSQLVEQSLRRGIQQIHRLLPEKRRKQCVFLLARRAWPYVSVKFILASQIVKRRASTFAHLKNAETLASAQLGLLSPITNKSFEFAILDVVDDELIMVEGVLAFIIFLSCITCIPSSC